MAIPYTSSYDLTLSFSDTCDQIGLSANTAVSITVPGANTLYYSAEFNYASNSNVFVGKNNTATVPALNGHNTQQYVAFKPPKRYVVGGDMLSFITPDTTAYVGLELRSIPSP